MEPPYGSRLIPVEIDERARKLPTRTVASYPTSNKLTPGVYRNVTFRDYARAINRIAALLEPLVGRSSTFETIAYYGPPDMRYHFVIVGAIKLGFKTLLSAPRNSAAMHEYLLDATACSTVIHASGIDVPKMIGESAAAHRKFHSIPALHDLIRDDTPEPQHYEFSKTFEEAEHDPYIVLHTSGSTGMPKPIVHTHGWASTFDWLGHYPVTPSGRRTIMDAVEPMRCYSMFPPWHAVGSEIWGIIPVAFLECEIVWGPTDRMPDAHDVFDIMEYAGVDQICSAASLFKQMTLVDGGIERMKRIKVYWFGGGPMDQALGDLLVRNGGQLRNVFGSTEAGIPGLQYASDTKAWNSINISPELPGMEFREQLPGIYELFFVRTEPRYDRRHGALHVFPDKKEWGTGDLFRKHPTQLHHWVFEGRVDDLITFANASKYNTLGFEAHLRLNPVVKAAILVGNGHYQTLAVVELEHTATNKGESHEEILDRIWRSIEEANAVAPKHARVSRTHVLVMGPDRPFLRTDKGTVQKKLTLQSLLNDIDAIYATHGDSPPKGAFLPEDDGAD